MAISLSKLTALEAALEYLLKAVPGEKLEYLAPGENPPGEIPIRTTQRGARGYYPSEVVGGGEEEAPAAVAEEPEDVELPDEEREIETVSASPPEFRTLRSDELPQRESWEMPDSFQEFEERRRQSSQVDSEKYQKNEEYRAKIAEQFEGVATALEDKLQKVGTNHQPFLGSSIDISKLTVDSIEHVGFTDGDVQGSPHQTGLGVNSEGNFTVTIEGKPFIYKIAQGENRAEQLAYTVDRALGLNIVPYVKAHNMNVDKLDEIFSKAQNENIPPNILDDLRARTVGAESGHFQEFCENCITDHEEKQEVIADMLLSKEGREEFIKLALLDFVTSNPDRHSNNWMVTKDKKILAIDNGYAGDGDSVLSFDDTAKISISKSRSVRTGFPWGLHEAVKAALMDDPDRNPDLSASFHQDKAMHEIVTNLADEVATTFDNYFKIDKMKDALGAINWKITTTDDLKQV